MKYLLLLLPILAACNHNPIVLEIPKADVIKQISVPAELLQLCPEIKSVFPTKLEDILLEDMDIIQLYGECRTRQNQLVKAVQEIIK